MEENRQKFIYKLRKNRFKPSDIDLIMSAYDLSKAAHRPQQRDGGERYFNHPRETAIILIEEIGTKDKSEVIIQLLHDTGEDTAIFGNITASYEEFVRNATFRLTRSFNSAVADGVIVYTKPHIDGKQFKDKEAVMDFYISMLKDHPNFFLLKMIDRLHNLRSLMKTDVAKIAKQIKETREVLLPAFGEAVQPLNVPRHVKERGKLVCQKIYDEIFKLEEQI